MTQLPYFSHSFIKQAFTAFHEDFIVYKTQNKQKYRESEETHATESKTMKHIRLAQSGGREMEQSGQSLETRRVRRPWLLGMYETRTVTLGGWQ